MQKLNQVIGILLIALTLGACGQNFSNGSRVGVITKLSQKGLIWNSWEGEMLIALPMDVAGSTQPEKFAFNVAPEAVEKVKAAMVSGKRVELVYRQWFIPPPMIEHQHVIVDVK